MSGTRTRERAALSNPFGMGGANEIAPLDGEAAALPSLMPAGGAGRASDSALAGVITAQRVAIKRDLGGVLAEAKALGGQAGDDFYYSIPYRQKNKDTGEFTTVYVEGPSIKAAMACASLYGNCRVGAQVSRETASHWFFSAIFQDLEKGVTVMREFQAQKPQEGRGKMDTARRADMDFQSAQSKAIRNVVVAAIPLVVDAAYEAAKSSLLQRVQQMGKEKATDYALQLVEELRVPISRVERKMAAKSDDWTARQIVRVVMDARAVRDGMLVADEVWPLAPNEQPAQQAETTVQESAAADGPMAAAEEAAGGSGSAADEAGAGAKAPAADAAERRQDPPPPAAERRQQRQRQQPPEDPPEDSAAPGGLDFGG